MHSRPLTAPQVIRTLALRTERILGRVNNRAESKEAFELIARVAVRRRARTIDAVMCDGVLTVALGTHGDEGVGVPSNQGIRRAVRRAFDAVPHLLTGPSILQPLIDPERRAYVDLTLIGRWYLARILSLESESAAGTDPEAVHQLRVALRRFRCIVRILEHKGPTAVTVAARRFIRELGTCAGAVRDLDVAGELISALHIDTNPRDVMVRRVRERREPALKHLRELLEGRAFLELQTSLVAALDDVSEPHQRMRKVARAHFYGELKGLQRALGGDLQQPEGFHEVRKRARRVRDAIDVLGDALKKPERRWRKRLQPLQAHLGSLNDTQVLLTSLGHDEALRDTLDALQRRRVMLLAELATPLAMLAHELHREVR